MNKYCGFLSPFSLSGHIVPVWRMISYEVLGKYTCLPCFLFLKSGVQGSMRAYDCTLVLLTIFAWLASPASTGPPTPPPESPLSLPEKIFNKIGELATKNGQTNMKYFTLYA